MIKRRYCFRILLVCLCLLLSLPVAAVKYNRRTGDGTYLFKCQGFCGPVRVTQISKDVFRVISIPYSGEVRARSARAAAKYACREGGSELEGIIKPGKERNGPQC